MQTEVTPTPTTLPRRYYTDPQVFSDEMERFYSQMWVYAGREAEIPRPGDYLLREIAGESIIVTRDASGRVNAFFNVCRHRGTRICPNPEGHFEGRIQCPYHGWTYALDGRLLGATHMQETNFCREDYPLNRVHADLWDGHFFLNLSANPGPLADQLGSLPNKFTAWRMQDLHLQERIVYDVKANWKLVVLNYNECLHCPVLHPCLNRLTNYLGADNDAPHNTYIGGSMGFRDGAQTMSLDGKLRRDYLPGLNDFSIRLDRESITIINTIKIGLFSVFAKALIKTAICI